MARKIGRNEPCPCGSGKKWKKCHGAPADDSGKQFPRDDFFEAFKVDRSLKILDILPQLSKLTKELRQFDLVKVLSAAAAVASLADNHTLTFRLDTLIFLAASHCAGDRVPAVADLRRWLNADITASDVYRFEDPPEDFAVGIVNTDEGDRLVLNGYLSGPDAYLQDVLDTLTSGPGLVEPIHRAARAALMVSNELIHRRGYNRHTMGNPGHGVALPNDDESLWRLVASQIVTNSDVARFAVSGAELSAFICTLEELKFSSLQARVVHNREKFLLAIGDAFLILFPTSIAESIVAYALAELRRLNALRQFGGAITRTQARRCLAAAMHAFEQEDVVRTGDGMEKGGGPPGISEIAFHLDGNKCLHFVIVHDDIVAAQAAGVNGTWTPAQNPALAEYFERVATVMSRRPGIEGGLTLVVMAGIGRSYEIAIPTSLPAGWFLQVWSLFDFERLVWLESDWPMTLRKLSQQRKVLSDYEIEFIGPDDATLYGHWRERTYHLIPEMALDQGPALIEISCSEVLPLRAKARKGLDPHSIYRPDRQEWVRVCRTAPISYFKEDEERPRYGSPDMAALGFLEGVIETLQRAWWLDCNPAHSPQIDRAYLYKIWETGQIWLERVVPKLEEMLDGSPRENIIITLDTSEISPRSDWTESAIRAIAPVSSYSVQPNEHGFTISLPNAFVAMGRNPENLAERMLAEAMLRGAASYAGLALSNERMGEIVQSLNISPAERHMHMFTLNDHRDHLLEFGSGDPQLLKDADLYFATAGIGYDAGLSPTIISDRDKCKETLNGIVDAFWSRCRARLICINRRSLVVRCLKNNEAVHAEQDNWTRTRRAVVALHTDKTDILRASQRAREEMDRTQISHRIMVEMATCTSPADAGREATQEDIDYLGAQILQMAATAQESDAMRAGAIPPWLGISLAGDLRLSSDFSELMRPYLFSHFEITHRRDIEEYDQNFILPKRGTKTEEEAFGAEFVSAFHEEYGISPIRIAEISTILAEDAYEEKTDVVVRTRASFMELLSDKGFSDIEIQSLIRHFVLPNRAAWDKASPPFRGKDWWPWRYRRHLSVMARPLIAINDTELAYAPGFCEDAFRHVIMESHTGAFDTEYFNSRSMKEYIGAANGRRGLLFNQSVAEVFRNAGWRVSVEVKMTQFQAPHTAASGDIDVIAMKDGVVYICECKELLFARTITEVVEQLGRFRGHHGDSLWRHTRRVDWVRSHPAKMTEIAGWESTEIRSLLVTSKIVPMQFTSDFPVEVLSIDSLSERLRIAGDGDLD